MVVAAISRRSSRFNLLASLCARPVAVKSLGVPVY